MAAQVNLFNSNTLTVNVIVNNGNSFTIPAASSPNYTPGVPTTNPTFTGGPATPGTIGVGTNYIQVTPSGAVQPFVANINLPNILWFSIQIYFFFQSNTSCSWLLLNNGQVAGQGIVTSETALSA